MDKSEKIVLGVDGCKAGWIAIKHTLGTADFEAVHFSDFESLVKNFDSNCVIAVDMPVALSNNAVRECDAKARRLLGKRASTLFSAPAVELLNCKSYEEVNQLSKFKFNKGISKQAWNIVPKIREVVASYKKNTSSKCQIFESHPELSFQAMNNGEVLLQSKKIEDGRLKRIQLIEDSFKVDLNNDFLNKFKKKDVATDDILDSFACLWTACRIAKAENIALGPPNLQIVI